MPQIEKNINKAEMKISMSICSIWRFGTVKAFSNYEFRLNWTLPVVGGNALESSDAKNDFDLVMEREREREREREQLN